MWPRKIVMHPEGDGTEGSSSAVPGPAAEPSSPPPSNDSPPAAPAAALSETPVGRTASSDYDDNPLLADEDLAIFDDQPGEPPAPEPSTPPQAVVAKTEATPPAPPVVTPQEPPAAAQPAAQAPAPSVATPPAEPPAPAETPEQAVARIQATRDAWRTETIARAKAAYEPIIAARSADLLTNPEKVLPELAAQLLVDATEAAMQAVASMVPNAIHSYNEGQAVRSRGEQEAAAAWPEIFTGQEAARRKQIFTEHAWNFRKMAPQASAADIIQKAGAATLIQLGLTRQTATPTNPPATASTAPATGFRPGGAGARTGGAPPAAKSDNVFVNLAEEFLQEDR